MTDENKNDPIVPPQTPPPVEPAPKKKPSFTADQMEVIQALIAEARGESANQTPNALSMYNTRDPKSIESVNVKRMYGKYVMGFKNLQTDPMKKTPKWLVYKADPSRGLLKEPYVTLLLQENDQTEMEPKEVLLLDYMNDREFYKAKCVNIDIKPDIKNYGYLGSNAEYAGEVDDKGNPVARQKVLAEVRTEERVFWAVLEGFAKPQPFISDFLA